MSSATRTRTRITAVDRILTLIDDCLADVASPRHPSVDPPAVLRRGRWEALPSDRDSAA